MTTATAYQRIHAASNDAFFNVVEAEIKAIKIPESNTHHAIARNDGWDEIAECARDEGFDEIADICEQAASEFKERFGE